MWGIEHAREIARGVTKAAGDEHGFTLIGVKPVCQRREQLALRAEQTVGQRQSPDAAVRMTRKCQVCAEGRILRGEKIAAVRKQQPVRLAFGGVQLTGKLPGRFLIGVAVGIVDAGKEDLFVAA